MPPLAPPPAGAHEYVYNGKSIIETRFVDAFMIYITIYFVFDINLDHYFYNKYYTYM